MTLDDLRRYLTNANVRAFLRVIRQRESSQDDSAYTVINGGQHFEAPPWRHPWHGIPTTQGARASGAYQFLGTTWSEVYERYGLTDFSPLSQDLGAVGLLVRRGALEDVVAGRFADAVRKCRLEWTSLPGASESSAGWTMDKALAVYTEYGGTLATQPAAPIEDRSTEYTPIDATTGGAMGPSFMLLSSILPSVLQLFSGAAQAKIAKATGDPEAARVFMQSLAANVGGAVGIPVTDNATAMQAVGKFTEAPTPAAIQALETKALATVDEIIRLADKSILLDQSMWAANVAGRSAASSVAIEEKRAGLWDMTRTLVVFSCAMMAGLGAALVGALLMQALSTKGTIDSGLLGLSGPILMAIVTAFAAIIAYRFDGTKASSEQGKALTDVIRERAKA